MLIFLLVLLYLNDALAQKRAACENYTPNPADKVRTDLLDKHNEYRAALAKGEVDQDVGENLMGSQSLFKLSYDCSLEGLAMAAIPSNCARKPSLDNIPAGKSVNYKMLPNVDDDAADTPSKIFPALDAWYDTRYEESYEGTVFFNSTAIEPFANMIYYKSIAVGCATLLCKDPNGAKHKLSVACVYGDAPKVGEEVYVAVKKAKDKGCTSGTTCKTLVKDGKCDTVKNGGTGLCYAKALTIDNSTSPSTAETSPPTSSTTDPTLTPMTQALRDEIVKQHNEHRSRLARGLVRNGKTGNPNCPEARNMYVMRYDMDLEKEAQLYADSCPAAGSDVSTRPDSGENIHTYQSTTIATEEIVVFAMEAWWTEIYYNGVNSKMQYTKYLEDKANAPLNFTQMAWAATYKVGCGVKRCNDRTTVVCRYRPRGNIYTQYIYSVGTNCGACSDTCKNGLCPAPTS